MHKYKQNSHCKNASNVTLIGQAFIIIELNYYYSYF